LDVAHWLDHTAYPTWRKKELLDQWRDCINPYERKPDGTLKYGKVKSFVKLESYPEYKHARCINARHDIFKCLVGPAFRAIDEEVYKNPYFIKKVPVSQRPEYIREHVYVPGRSYVVTDHSQYEAAFTADLMEDCEFQLYDYMLSNHPFHDDFMALMREVVAGTNVCSFKDLVIEIQATRMSGEMCTSLGNGFANLMSFLFEAKRRGASDVRGIVEGDDGLFSMEGPHPTKEGMAENGFTVKMEIVQDFNEASFCGFIFDPEEGINIKTPLELLTNFGWLPARYMNCNDKKLKELYRCKALSYAHQFPGCPVVAAFAHYVLRITHGNRARMYWNDMYMRAKMLDIFEQHNRHGVPHKTPGVDTRLLFEKKFGITIAHQLAIEHYFNTTEDLVVSHPTLDYYGLRLNQLHYDRYAISSPPELVNQPPLHLHRTPVERDPASLLILPRGLERAAFWSVPRK